MLSADESPAAELIDIIKTWIEEVYWIDPRHEVRDTDKVIAIVASIRDHGWQGAPIVVHDATALTGAHRIAAIEVLHNNGSDIKIPVVDIADVCNVCDVDWEAHCEEWDGLTYDRDRTIADKLPPEVVEWLGLDLH